MIRPALDDAVFARRARGGIAFREHPLSGVGAVKGIGERKASGGEKDRSAYR
jgi:hypothetical protein